MTIVVPEPDRSASPRAGTVEAGRTTATIEVLDPGPFTTVQDAPGRVAYWHVGVPPNGPMDELSHHLVNRVVGNVESAATLELTGSGPTLRFATETVIALGGAAMPLTVAGRAAPRWVPVTVPAGSVVEVGANAGPGRVEVDRPGRAEERFHPVGGQEVGRAVRSDDDGERPVVGQDRGDTGTER